MTQKVVNAQAIEQLALANKLSLEDLAILAKSGATDEIITNWLEANKLIKVESWKAFVDEQWLERKGTDLLGTHVKSKKAFAQLLKDEYELIKGNNGVNFVVSLT